MSYRLSVPARIDAIPAVVDEIMEKTGPCAPLVAAALTEAMTNAVIYGALGVASAGPDRRTEDLLARIREAEATRAAGRSIDVQVSHSEQHLCVVIRDPGLGFDWRAKLVEPESGGELMEGGRGIKIMRAVADSLEWNEPGNELRLGFRLSAPLRVSEGRLEGDP